MIDIIMKVNMYSVHTTFTNRKGRLESLGKGCVNMLLKRCDYSGIQISTEPNKNQNKQKKSHKLSVIKPVLHKTKREVKKK